MCITSSNERGASSSATNSSMSPPRVIAARIEELLARRHVLAGDRGRRRGAGVLGAVGQRVEPASAIKDVMVGEGALFDASHGDAQIAGPGWG